MSKIPPELENLMWTLAESGNQQAVSEFEARFPHLRVELAKRTGMVRSLRSTRPGNVTSPAIPRFVPGAATATEPSRGMYTAAFVFAAIALSVFAYTAVVAHHPRPVEPQSLPQIPLQNEPASQTAPLVRNSPAVNPPLVYPPAVGPAPNTGPRSLRDEPPILTPTEHTWEKPQTLAMRNVPLQTVLEAVGEEGGLAMDIPPKMPNPTITVDYHDVSAESILQDLGRTYAFTPILSDDGSAIMIPAVAHNTPPAKVFRTGPGQ